MALKTAISQLQELMMRKGIIPHYELIKEEGLPNEPIFHMKVVVGEIEAIGINRSKKLAKQDAAKEALKLLGIPIAQTSTNSTCENRIQPLGDDNYNNSTLPILLDRTVITKDQNQTTGVKDLQELCIRYGLPSPVFENEISAGPPHHKIFSITCKLGTLLYTEAIAHTKKQAKHQAAQTMFKSIRELKEFQLSDDITMEDIHKNPTQCQISKTYSEMHLMLSSIDSTIKDNILKHIYENKSEEFLLFLENEYNVGHDYYYPTKMKIEQSICNLSINTIPKLTAQGIGDTNEIAKEKAMKNLYEILLLLLS